MTTQVTEPKAMTTNSHFIAMIAIGSVGVMILVIFVYYLLYLCGAYCYSKRERPVRPAPIPRFQLPPPAGPDESQTITISHMYVK